MAGETIITVVGNLTADPELRYTQNGQAVVNATIASTPRAFDRQSNEWKDQEALFLRFSAWKEMAEHIAGSLTKGMRVIAQGRLKQRSYETKEGEKRTVFELEVDEIGPSLRYATAQVTRAAGGGGQQAQQGGQQGFVPQTAYQGPPQGAPQQGPPQQAFQQPQGYPAPQQGQPPQQGYPAPGQQQPPQQAAPQQQAYPAQQPQQPSQDVWATPGAGAYGDDTPF
jgi:single-strand DNA-binding protein